MNASLEVQEKELQKYPITFINAEEVGVDVIDQPYSDIVAESDTFNQGSGDSDTI